MNKLIVLLIMMIIFPIAGYSEPLSDAAVQKGSLDHGSHRKGHRHRRGLRLFHRHHSHGKHHYSNKSHDGGRHGHGSGHSK